MKKNFITSFLFAAVAALSFTACGEEANIDGPNPVNPIKPVETKTVFSSTDDGTRTSIDRMAHFYWEIGDKIWVDGGLGYKASSQSSIAGKQTSAKFVVDSTYTSERIKVIYTGYADGDTTKTYYNKVTVAHQQTQKAWNDGSHIGASGDCATGYAYKKPGGYQFTLDHKATYLMLYPYLHSNLSGYTLEKIEIYSNLSGSPIAGTFPFDFENGLLDASQILQTPLDGTGKEEITLNCGTGSDFQLSTDFPADITSTTTTYRHCFAVIAPGTHQLTIKYITKNTSNQTVEFVKDLDMKPFEPNGVYPFIHELKDPLLDFGFEYNERSYGGGYASNVYQWGGTTPWNGGLPYTHSTQLTATAGFWANVPNSNAMTWYLRGGGYRDYATVWTLFKKDGTTEKHRGGVWLKKKAHLAATSGFSTTTPTHMDGTTTNLTSARLSVGRPNASEIANYFFLPALNWSSGSNSRPNQAMRFWISTAYDAAIAWTFEVNGTGMTSGALYSKTNVWHCNPLNRDGTPWFQ